MGKYLQGIHSGLMWEFGPGLAGGHRLVITPEQDRHLRPLVDVILERAPQLDGWEFYPYRLPESAEQAGLAVQARTGWDLTGTTARAAVGELNLIDLAYHSPQCTGPDDQEALQGAFVATESLLGEEVLDKWIGVIEAFPPDPRVKTIGLQRLRPTVSALIGSIHEQQPVLCDGWYDGEESQWSLIELHPEPQDDYPAQRDLVLATAGVLPMFETHLQGARFTSARFTRSDETFCYVKTEAGEGVSPAKLERRHRLEAALQSALRAAKLGWHVGGGTGLRYVYVHLALADLDAGCRAVRRALQQAAVPKRSWILFFDDELALEWIGAYDDTSPPPRAPARSP
jgi:hypothetical protein